MSNNLTVAMFFFSMMFFGLGPLIVSKINKPTATEVRKFKQVDHTLEFSFGMDDGRRYECQELAMTPYIAVCIQSDGSYNNIQLDSRNYTTMLKMIELGIKLGTIQELK